MISYRDINAGASGANHGLLHSGGRYVFADQGSAKECREEGELLKKMAPHCIEDTGGLFVAVEGDDEKYVADFPLMCSQCNIPVQSMDIALGTHKGKISHVFFIIPFNRNKQTAGVFNTVRRHLF